MTETEPARRATFREVLAIPEFRALYVAETLSVAGDQLARIAIAILVYTKTGSTTLTGLSYAVSYVPWVLGGPLLSGYADRKPRRDVMVVTDLTRAVLVALIAVPHVPYQAAIIGSALVALASPPFSSARSSSIPDVVGEGRLYTAASTLGNTTNQLAVVGGFALGGGLVGLIGPHSTLFIDALTFVLSAFVATRYMTRRPAVLAGPPASWWMDLRDGAGIVFKIPRLRWLIVMTWLVLGTAVATETAAVPFAHHHGRGSEAAGLLIASLPLGMVVGALILGRLLDADRAETLMGPLAIATPALLAVTAADPSPTVTGVLWFICGLTSASTIVANRVFVASAPREARGRAFGIAVAGIAGAQGLFSLMTGAIAAHVGPAKAVADVALPALAILVVFAIFDSGFRTPANLPILDVLHDQREAQTMAHPAPAPNSRAWVLNAALSVCSVFAIVGLHGRHAYVHSSVPGWWLFAVFVAGQAYPMRFEFRHQAFHIVLETVPLVLGLVFFSPLELTALRAGSLLLVKALFDGQPPVRWWFNTVSSVVCSLAAVVAFRALSSSGHGLHSQTWPGLFAGVVASETVAGLLVAFVLLLTGSRSSARGIVRVIAVAAGISVVMTFFAIITAAALDYDAASAWAISVFVVLALAGSQTYHRLSERATALDQLYKVARELGPLATAPSAVAPALIQLRDVIRAGRLELVVDDPDLTDSAASVSVTLSDSGSDETLVQQLPRGATALTHWKASHSRRLFPKAFGRARREGDFTIAATVASGDQVSGILTATRTAVGASPFERADLRLLEAAADQLSAALEKGRLIESLRKAATLDTLTGLANLDSLRAFLDTTLEGSAGGVLVLANLDRFHDVNDMLGHDAGDLVLAEVARRLETSQTPGSLIARVGGDQFAIAIPGAAGSEVARLAAMAIKSRVDGSIRLAKVSADVRVTIGIARAPDHGSDAANLLRRAEMAMAAAKGTTSGIGEWEPGYERDGSRRLQILTGLRTALSEGALKVEYQPKFRLGPGEVSGFEALVRWTHPELGPVSPAEFIPIAEATGLISALTSNVLRDALAACRTWHDAGKPVGVAVNVSARSLDDSVLLGQVAAMLTASGLEPRWLTLEITESSVMADQSRSLALLRELRMLGVRLSIDDFGTGYSSLHQLRGLPVHEVKIDKSFVDSVDLEEADRAVVRAVVELCESLGLETVAEGVEKASQAIALEALGVRQVQGYFHGKPMPAVDVETWLRSHRVPALADNPV